MRFKSNLKKRRWDGLIVCPDDYEVDHPQKYIRVRPDGQPVPDPRPWNEEFMNVCYIWSTTAYADLATADCARADNNSPTYAQALAYKG